MPPVPSSVPALSPSGGEQCYLWLPNTKKRAFWYAVRMWRATVAAAFREHFVMG